jgi:hypothetical protein
MSMPGLVWQARITVRSFYSLRDVGRRYGCAEAFRTDDPDGENGVRKRWITAAPESRALGSGLWSMRDRHASWGRASYRRTSGEGFWGFMNVAVTAVVRRASPAGIVTFANHRKGEAFDGREASRGRVKVGTWTRRRLKATAHVPQVAAESFEGAMRPVVFGFEMPGICACVPVPNIEVDSEVAETPVAMETSVSSPEALVALPLPRGALRSSQVRHAGHRSGA